MRFSIPVAVTTALSLASVANGIKVLMNNDDGFGSGNIRELYRLLKGAGHDGMPGAEFPVVSSSQC